MKFRSLLKRVATNARRLKAAAERRFSSPGIEPAASIAPAAQRAAEAGREGLYPGLPGAALKTVVEASIDGVALTEHSLTRFAMYAALSNRLAAHDGLAKNVFRYPVRADSRGCWG